MPTDPLSTPDPWAEAVIELCSRNGCSGPFEEGCCYDAAPDDPSRWCIYCLAARTVKQAAAERQQATAQQAEKNAELENFKEFYGDQLSEAYLHAELTAARAEVASLTQRLQVQDADFAALSAESHRFEEQAKLYEAEHLLRVHAEAQVTAQAAEIARLHAERENDFRIWERRIDDALGERDAYRRNANIAAQRQLEAAEQQITALQQHIAEMDVRISHYETEHNLPDDCCMRAVAAHLTGGPAT